AQWKVQAEKTCSGDTSWLRFATKSTLGDPSFNQTCELPVPLPCLDKDTLPPIAEPDVALGKLKTIEFHDDRQKDKGIEKIEASGFDPAKITVSIDQFQKCTKNWVKVSMLQIDTTVRSCVDLTVTDCAGNITTRQICFDKWPPNPDTVSPKIFLIGHDLTDNGTLCNAKWDTLLAVDDTLYDLGLNSIDYTPGVPPVNMELVVTPFSTGVTRHGFIVRTLDKMIDGSISIRATDRSGNFVDHVLNYCTIPDEDKPVLTVFQLNPYEWSVFVEDDRPYDRRIDTIEVFNRQNVTLTLNGLAFEPTRDYTRWQRSFTFNIQITDTSKFASFCVRAKDLADSSSLSQSTRWWSGDTCLSRDTIRDMWSPNITLDPPPAISPTVITVTVDDIHFINGQRVGWDKGLDSVWFTNAKGMVIPSTLRLQCADKFVFDVSVSDTLALDDRATICINVIDCAGNFSDTCWYYPIIPDSLPPIIQGVKAYQTALDITVTDSTTYDRGLRRIVMTEFDNFDPVNIQDTTGRLIEFQVKVTKPGTSSVGKLEAIDVYGMMSPGGSQTREEHRADIDLAIWVQNFGFKTSTKAEQNQTARIPIYFVKTDTFSLYRKGIREFEFTFDLVGHNGFSYVGYEQANTMSDGFAVVDNIQGNRITLTGSSPTPLQEDSVLIYVLINSAADDLTRQTVLTPVSIEFNGGDDYEVFGKNSVAKLPAPYGSLSGGSIIAVGRCAPEMVAGNDNTGSVIYMDHARPNPFEHSTKFNFTVPEDGLVSIVLYNSLGQQVKTIVNEVLVRGQYSVVVNADGLPSGSYYARMQSGAQVFSRNLRISR
ncbi:MAG TPA: T9SS type A sorting domain-containing protein, partial [Candidatus Kapabacteria bacterium]|nr:T9SS type A sorting domain-containing protein [Candidatus Kapabacteria bacterium]